jgi:hypothetical protein
LSQRERERLKVLHEVKQKYLTQAEAAERLKVTDRQVRRLLLALAERGMVPWFTGCEVVPRIASCTLRSSKGFWPVCGSGMRTSGLRWPPNT